MASKLYVGNLPYSATTDQLREYFATAGNVVDAVVITDRSSGRSKGFGFVELKKKKMQKKQSKLLTEKILKAEI